MRRLLIALVLVASSCSPAQDAGEVLVVALVRTPSGDLERLEFSSSYSGLQGLESDLNSRSDVVVFGTVGGRRVHGDPLLQDQWGSSRLSYSRVGELSSASGVVVAVLDTGVDGSHPDLAGRVLRGFDARTGALRGDTDPNGHGTHVAGIIAAIAGNGIGVEGFASGVSVLPVRVLGADGYGDDADLATGMVWAVDNGADIINMSVGGAEDMSLLRDAARYAYERDVLLVASAGNDALWGNAPSFPAAIPEVVAVGAVSQGDMRAMFSNTGPYLELVAPGSSIVSTWPGGRYLYSSGTSMSAPFVSASAALVMASTGLRGSGLRSALTSSALDLGSPGRDSEFGFGMVDPFSAVGLPGISGSPGGFEMPGLLPGLPDLPTFDLPSLPDIEELLASLPPLPDPSELLPSLPDMADPGFPDLPGGGESGLPERMRAEVGVSASADSSGAVSVVLSGPRALVAFRRVSWVAYGADGSQTGSGEVVLDIEGLGSAYPGGGWRVLEVSYPGSLTTLPASFTLFRD